MTPSDPRSREYKIMVTGEENSLLLRKKRIQAERDVYPKRGLGGLKKGEEKAVCFRGNGAATYKKSIIEVNTIMVGNIAAMQEKSNMRCAEGED